MEVLEITKKSIGEWSPNEVRGAASVTRAAQGKGPALDDSSRSGCHRNTESNRTANAAAR